MRQESAVPHERAKGVQEDVVWSAQRRDSRAPVRAREAVALTRKIRRQDAARDLQVTDGGGDDRQASADNEWQRALLVLEYDHGEEGQAHEAGGQIEAGARGRGYSGQSEIQVGVVIARSENEPEAGDQDWPRRARGC